MAGEASTVAAPATGDAATVTDGAAVAAATAVAPAAVVAPVQAAAETPEAKAAAADAETARVAALSPEARAAEEAAKAVALEAGKPKAPESYTDFKPPEGVVVSKEIMDSFKAAAKESGLSQEAAQSAFEKLVPSFQKGNVETVNALAKQASDKWLAAARTDTEIGGEQFDANLATAKRGLAAFGGPGFTKFLNDSGLGNHPDMIRTFVKIGKLVGDDGKYVGSTTTPAGDAAPEDKLWPKKT